LFDAPGADGSSKGRGRSFNARLFTVTFLPPRWLPGDGRPVTRRGALPRRTTGEDRSGPLRTGCVALAYEIHRRASTTTRRDRAGSLRGGRTGARTARSRHRVAPTAGSALVACHRFADTRVPFVRAEVRPRATIEVLRREARQAVPHQREPTHTDSPQASARAACVSQLLPFALDREEVCAVPCG
jgi:hypothetical protein